jgi:hypothetical protein
MCYQARTRCAAFIAMAVAIPCAVSEAIEFRLPINCEIGRTCEIQNYVDLDPSGGVRDYQCGQRSAVVRRSD